MDIKAINDAISYVVNAISSPVDDVSGEDSEIFYKKFKDKLPKEVLDHVLEILYRKGL